MPSEYRELRALQGRPLVDRRRGDRHKEGYKRPNPPKKQAYRKVPSKWERRLIVAWDGEGANLDDGTHVYNLLANSDGTYIINHDGLSTKEVFDFFCKYGNPKAINVIYGGGYDINMALVDMPRDKLEILWKSGTVFWENYRIYWSPRKHFIIQKFIKRGDGTYRRISFTLWDVLGYFQSSFVQACRKWLGDLPILDEIENMKLQRSVFSVDRIEDIIAYNKSECDLLVLLMEALFESLDVAGIRLTRFDGAGSIAAALLRMNSVVKHKGEPSQEAILYARYAYSGGRIEAPFVGTTEGIGYAH